MTVEIPLTQGYVALIDDEDVELVSGRSWCASVYPNGQVYAQGSIGTRRIFMHRLLMGFPSGEVSHENSDGLDNRRANLRVITTSKRMGGARKWRTKTSSRFKGVTWFKRDSRWRAQITVNGKVRHLGYFDDEREAAEAYNQAAREAWGEFAKPGERLTECP